MEVVISALNELRAMMLGARERPAASVVPMPDELAESFRMVPNARAASLSKDALATRLVDN